MPMHIWLPIIPFSSSFQTYIDKALFTWTQSPIQLEQTFVYLFRPLCRKPICEWKCSSCTDSPTQPSSTGTSGLVYKPKCIGDHAPVPEYLSNLALRVSLYSHCISIHLYRFPAHISSNEAKEGNRSKAGKLPPLFTLELHVHLRLVFLW